MVLEDAGRPDGANIWPDNWLAVQVFAALSTQWRIAPSGYMLGLDYSAIPPTLELLGVERPEWLELFADLRVMEHEALDVLAKRHG